MQTEEGWEGSRGGVGVAETEVRSNYPELQALYGRKKKKKNEARGGDTRLVFFSYMLITTTRMHATKAIFNLDFKKSLLSGTGPA